MMKNKELIFFILFLIGSFLIEACSSHASSENKNTGKEIKGSVNINFIPHKARIITTAKGEELRLTDQGEVEFVKTIQPIEIQNSIFVNPNKQFQKFVGIGGAITDASAIVFSKLPAAKQKELIKAYYSKDGINYSIIRTNINSCDFSRESYTYLKEGDTTLKSFNISHDLKYKIPLIKRACNSIKQEKFIYASPWSPPAFMKTNKNMLHGGKLLPEYHNLWANYYIKFIRAYQKEGIIINGVTIQNEPMAEQTWESCVYTAEEERDFLRDYLGPVFEKNGMKDKKIIIWDHNRDLLSHRANVILEDKDAAKYVWGVGFHWYETWRKGKALFANVRAINEEFPNKNLIFTEGCNENYSANNLGYWENAERYGEAMIKDFNAGTVAWTDWNILLNYNGGPNHVGNYCFSPVHANANYTDLIFTPSYYYIGQFSKYIHPDARRISTSTSYSFLLSTSFINNDGRIVTVVMNTKDEKLKYYLVVANEYCATLTIPAHAIQTVLY